MFLFAENQLCAELTGSSAFLTHVENTQPLGQSEELMKQYNHSSVPFSGKVPERKKHAVIPKPKTQPNIKDFDKKCSSYNLHHRGINSSSNTNDVNFQESSSDSSHIIPSPLKFSSESKINFKKLLFTAKAKPEETVYDADMELTASDAGELLTVTAKDKLHQNQNNNASSDKMSANFRKVKYSKKDKEKTKSKTEVSSNFYVEERATRADNNKVSRTTDSQTQLFHSQTEQLPTGNSVGKRSLLNTGKYNQAQLCPSKAKDAGRTCQVNLMSPRKQETNKETFSGMSEDMESKTQKADSNSSGNKIPLEVCCAANLPFQGNTSNTLPSQQSFLHTDEKCDKPKRNRKAFQNPSKMDKAKYHGEESGQHEESILKRSQTEIHQHDSKRKQDQKDIIKRKYNKKSSSRQSGETGSDSIHKIPQKADRKSSCFSPRRLKHTLAKASRKACIVPKENLTQFSACKNEELKTKDALHAGAVSGNKVTETQQMQVALVTQNALSINTPQAQEQVDGDANMLKKVDSPSVAHKTPHISNSPDNQIKRKPRFSAGNTETRPEKNYFRHTAQGRQNILDDQGAYCERDSLMSKLKYTAQKSEFLKFLPVKCSKSVPLNTDSFFQEGLSSVELPALDNHDASMKFSIPKNSEICGENDHTKALDTGKAEQKLDHVSKETDKKTLTPCPGKWMGEKKNGILN